MKRRIMLFGLLFLPLALLAAMFNQTAAAAGPGDARVRVVHASPDAPNVDVWVGGAYAYQNVPFGAIGDYAILPAGSYLVQVEPAGAGGAGPFVISATLNFAAGTDTTIAATDLLANITPLVLADNNALPAVGNAHVRFIHASPDAPAVDITLTDGTIIFGDYAFQEVSPYTPIPVGTYNLQVRLQGTSTVVLNLPGITLDDRNVYTVYAVGLAGGSPALSAAISLDAGPSRVRVAHLSPDAPNVDALVNGAAAFTNVGFETVTPYAALTNNEYQIQVEPAGAGGAGPFVISATLTLDPNVDYTIAAIDVLANITPLVLVDDNSRPAAGNAHVRFVHASPNAPAVDITLTDGTVLFGNVAFGEASNYLPVPGGVYDLEVRLQGTSTVVLSLPGIALYADHVYTVFATGLVGSSTTPLNAILITDASYFVPTDVSLTGFGGESNNFSWGMIAAALTVLLLLGAGMVIGWRRAGATG
ncbi:MAG: DUF4397 domain-containing protein [Anaerolineae bacterium]|nr:DUF4397 domain-containing protein [Anaerolineae bacterium]